ncbi:hypothetical protein [Nocardia farcinica]|uniref:LpxL/LpxP family acyltransferase n=1 Tax=Nocardia farcinica TaxID=37329 RepID=UPI003CC80660
MTRQHQPENGPAHTAAARGWDLAYAAGWRLVRALPERWAMWLFLAAADRAARDGGPAQLRRNLARVLAVTPDRVPDDLVRASLRSYARYWCEAFRLPSMDPVRLAERIENSPPRRGPKHHAVAGGGGVLLCHADTGRGDHRERGAGAEI